MSNRNAELGTLIVVVLKARNLNDKHSFYKQDVFASVSLNGASQRTHVDVKGGQHPEWDAELRFPILKQIQDKSRKLEVACFAKEPRSEDILGKGVIDITEVLKTGEFDDWVPLNVDGVVRGDLYLEMTFFSNEAPRPAALAPQQSLRPQASSVQQAPLRPQGSLAPQSHLTRRPSKLPPSERLSRPPQANPVLQNLLSDNTNRNGGREARNNTPSFPQSLAPSSVSSRSSSASSVRRADSPLPPPSDTQIPGNAVPLPATLLPGGGRPRPQHHDSASSLRSSPQLPLNLRSGPGRQVSQPVVPQHSQTHGRHSSASSISPSREEYVPLPLPGSQIQRPGSTQQYGHYPGATPTPLPNYHAPPSSAPSWTAEPAAPSGPLSFPVPMVSSTQGAPSYLYTISNPAPYSVPSGQDVPVIYSNYGAIDPRPPLYNQGPPLGSSTPSSELPDPYLIARYQTPLPLPPGSQGQHSSPQSQPLPPPQFVPPPQERPDQTRIEALRNAENEAARRKEQEERDLALALQLDKELNLGPTGTLPPGNRPDNSHMPGEW